MNFHVPLAQGLLRSHVDQAPPRLLYLLSLTRLKHWHGIEYKYDKQLRDHKARTKRSHRRKQKAMLDGWASSLVDDWESYGRCHQHHLSAAGERPASAKATFMAGTRPQSKREARRQEAAWRQWMDEHAQHQGHEHGWREAKPEQEQQEHTMSKSHHSSHQHRGSAAGRQQRLHRDSDFDIWKSLFGSEDGSSWREHFAEWRTTAGPGSRAHSGRSEQQDGSKTRWQQHSRQQSAGSQYNTETCRCLARLGLPVSASLSQEVLKQAFHKMAMQCHPDRHPNGSKAAAQVKFQEVQAAHAYLQGVLVPGTAEGAACSA